MMRAAVRVLFFGAVCVAGLAAQERTAPTAAEIDAAIGRLGSLEFETRVAAAKLLRRAPTESVVPALAAAARKYKDEYARFRALVILSGFGGETTAAVMNDVKSDRNDRLRTVAFSWYAVHPDPAVLPALLTALEQERSEFVRPALTRAVAALGKDPRAQAALLPLVSRGEDFFRGAVIEALGDNGARYAFDEITAVANLEGPLQDDAITALGKLGDRSSLPVLAVLQKSAPRELQPTIAASLCMLGFECDATDAYLVKMLDFGASSEVYQPVVRGAAHALGVLASRGREKSLTTLLDAGVGAKDPVQSPLALNVGLVAIRNPGLLLQVLERRTDRDAAIGLLRDAFDMLSEDFDEERFFAEVRRAYWAAAAGSPRRELTQRLIEILEF